MTRRLPIFSTILVGLAVCTMVALGIWQLDRRNEKARAVAQWRANLTRPAAAYPGQNPVDQTYLFRTLSANCLRVIEWRSTGGKRPDGRTGWRQIATCATGAEGPGLVVDIGMSNDPAFKPKWQGGRVRGIATQEPQSSTLLDKMLGRTVPPRLMIVHDGPVAGLVPSAKPDPASVPDNHFAYAIQWFLFAGIAIIIYGLALRRRRHTP